MEYFLTLIGFALATSATPGPNVLMVAASAAQVGIRRVVPHMLGVSIGFPVMFLAIALGLGMPFESYPWLHRSMQVAGGAWLLWLAWKIASAPPPGESKPSPPLGFFGAAAFQWVNPKAWMIVLATLPTFTTPGEPLLPQALIVAGVFTLVGLPCLLLWAWLGQEARRLLGDGRRLRAFNWSMAALLILSLVPLVR